MKFRVCYYFIDVTNNRILPESPYWLMVHGKWKKAERSLRKIAAVNGRVYPEHIDLQTLERPRVRANNLMFSSNCQVTEMLHCAFAVIIETAMMVMQLTLFVCLGCRSVSTRTITVEAALVQCEACSAISSNRSNMVYSQSYVLGHVAKHESTSRQHIRQYFSHQLR
jgi:hypothetical protein